MKEDKHINAASIGVIGISDEKVIVELEKEWGKPVKKIDKNGKVVLLMGKGLFKKDC